MERIRFRAEYAKSGRTRCLTCREIIEKNGIRIEIWRYRGSEYYHLKCYQPKLKQFIIESDVRIFLEGEESETLKAWLNEGNSQHIPLNKPYHSPPELIKRVDSKASKFRRAGMEVFKFMDPVQTLQILAPVCKEFYHMTWDEELGQFYCIQEFKVTDEVENWKNHYSMMTLKSCFGCRKILDEDAFYRCPLLSKPLCGNCRYNNPKFRLLNKSRIHELYKVNPNTLNIKFGNGQMNTKKAYVFMVEKALCENRQLNKDKLLKEYQKHSNFSDFKELVDSIKLEDMNKGDMMLPDDSLVANSFYPHYGKIYRFIKSKEGGIKAIRSLL